MPQNNKDRIYGNFVKSAEFYEIIKNLSKNTELPVHYDTTCNANAYGFLSYSDNKKNTNENEIAQNNDINSKFCSSAESTSEDSRKLNIAFIAFYGSRNYGLDNNESDYDFFIVYYPNFHNFFHNKFIRYSAIESNYDYFITPFHEFIHHTLNGNIKFIEPLICGSIFFPDELNLIFKNNISSAQNGVQITPKSPRFLLSNLIEEAKRFILLNYKKNIDAFTGLANNKRLNIIKNNYTSNTLIYKEIYGYDIKEAINALRILYLAQNYLTTGKIDFFVKNNDAYIEFEKIYNDIKNKIISKKDILQLIDLMINGVRHQIDEFLNDDNDNKNNKKFCSIASKEINKNNYNCDLTKIKEELAADIKKNVENICKNNL